MPLYSAVNASHYHLPAHKAMEETGKNVDDDVLFLSSLHHEINEFEDGGG